MSSDSVKRINYDLLKLLCAKMDNVRRLEEYAYGVQFDTSGAATDDCVNLMNLS